MAARRGSDVFIRASLGISAVIGSERRCCFLAGVTNCIYAALVGGMKHRSARKVIAIDGLQRLHLLLPLLCVFHHV